VCFRIFGQNRIQKFKVTRPTILYKNHKKGNCSIFSKTTRFPVPLSTGFWLSFYWRDFCGQSSGEISYFDTLRASMRWKETRRRHKEGRTTLPTSIDPLLHLAWVYRLLSSRTPGSRLSTSSESLIALPFPHVCELAGSHAQRQCARRHEAWARFHPPCVWTRRVSHFFPMRASSWPASPSMASVPGNQRNRMVNRANQTIYRDFVQFSKKNPQILNFYFEPNFDWYFWYYSWNSWKPMRSGFWDHVDIVILVGRPWQTVA
jgi:hypothetical protein